MASSRRASRAKRAPEAVGRQHVLELLVSEWAVALLQALDRGPKLNAAMRAEFLSASRVTLDRTLRNLQMAGLVWRKVYPTSPARVEYSLTALGKSFIAPLNGLCEWAEQHERELCAISARKRKPAKIGTKKQTKSWRTKTSRN